MKKSFLLGCITVLCLLPAGCKQVEHTNAKANDAISEAVYAEFGDKLYYRGCYRRDDKWRYYYMIHDYEEKDVIASVQSIVSRVMEEEDLDRNTMVYFSEEMNRTSTEVVAFISNYRTNYGKTVQFDGLEYLRINGTHDSIYNETSPYNEPSTYFNIEGIKYLEISKKIAKIAEEQGVDWYEVFPELETLEILDR